GLRGRSGREATRPEAGSVRQDPVNQAPCGRVSPGCHGVRDRVGFQNRPGRDRPRALWGMVVLTELQQARERLREQARQAEAEMHEAVRSAMLAGAAKLREIATELAGIDHLIGTLERSGLAPAVALPRAAADADRPGAEPLQLPAVTGPVAKVIVTALAKAGPRGMSGAEVNEVVRKAGYQLDASEKSKTKLKRDGKIIHDRKAKMWYALGQFRAQPSQGETE
ncbi:hypothetical protein ABEV34_27695, partial [Methylorubrum rhodesianum]